MEPSLMPPRPAGSEPDELISFTAEGELLTSAPVDIAGSAPGAAPEDGLSMAASNATLEAWTGLVPSSGLDARSFGGAEEQAEERATGLAAWESASAQEAATPATEAVQSAPAVEQATVAETESASSTGCPAAVEPVAVGNAADLSAVSAPEQVPAGETVAPSEPPEPSEPSRVDATTERSAVAAAENARAAVRQSPSSADASPVAADVDATALGDAPVSATGLNDVSWLRGSRRAELEAPVLSVPLFVAANTDVSVGRPVGSDEPVCATFADEADAVLIPGRPIVVGGAAAEGPLMPGAVRAGSIPLPEVAPEVPPPLPVPVVRERKPWLGLAGLGAAAALLLGIQLVLSPAALDRPAVRPAPAALPPAGVTAASVVRSEAAPPLSVEPVAEPGIRVALGEPAALTVVAPAPRAAPEKKKAKKRRPAGEPLRARR